MDQSRLIIVANRLPYSFSKHQDQWQAKRSSGGLVRALLPVLRQRGGVWIGWDGLVHNSNPADYPSMSELIPETEFKIEAISYSAEEHKNFYVGFSNEILWPLFHNQPTRCNFNPDYWQAYLTVNRKFAQHIAEHHQAGDFIWVHDYHLMNVAKELCDLGIKKNLGFFLHIPFPPPDIFLMLPWRKELLQGMLEYERLGFQTQRDVDNFLASVKALYPEAKIHRNDSTSLEINVKEGNKNLSHKINIRKYPISIDYTEFDAYAQTDEVKKLRRQLSADLPKRKIIFALERLDYSKGIPNKLIAFRDALARHPDLCGHVTLILCVIPSREDIPEYQQLRQEIECLVSEINGAFTKSGWVPIHYIYRTLLPDQLVAYYSAADIALVTPLIDGMNLVAKEFCACQTDEEGVLILSEFAGAAVELRDALLVNPYDSAQVADVIYQAYSMPLDERRQRMRSLRQQIQSHDIFTWVSNYLQTAGKLT